MWIAKAEYWNLNTTQLEKFAIERIIQRCDFSENISNKHRTSNGYTQLKELIQYCELSLKRSRTVKTLIVVLEEAISPYVKQNISSDCIVKKYFVDLKEYVLEFDRSKLLGEKNQPNQMLLQKLTQKLKLFEKQLDQFYFANLCDELLYVNYGERTAIERTARELSDLIDLLVPYLVFQGYSIASISEVLRQWLKCNYHITINKFLAFFNFKSHPHTFLQYLGDPSKEAEDFLSLLKSEITIDIEEVHELGTEFTEKYPYQKNGLYAKYTIDTLDPHKHVRSNFDRLLKKLVAHRERQSLAVFNDFFNNSFWHKKPNQPLVHFKKINLDGDPINVNVRGKTLRDTLTKLANQNLYSFSDLDNIPSSGLTQLENSIYYYNLALGSKSIENSLSLLWTSLEAIHPYVIYTSDIAALQSFLSKGLSIGSFARDIHAFAVRFIHVNQQTNGALRNLGTRYFKNIDTSEGLLEWYYWMKTVKNVEKVFIEIKKSSELLAYQFTKIAKPIREQRQEVILNRLTHSAESIKFQLQRIYLHRNRIVHSGDMINEYTNLWMHLEWYVGKILAYFLVEYHFNKSNADLASIYQELEADQEYLRSYLEKNKRRGIGDLPIRLEKLLFKHCWLAY